MATAPAPVSERRLSLPWVIAIGGLITAISLGVRSTFGLFLDPVVESIDVDRGTFALAIAIQNLVWGFSQPIAGAISDRFGSARVLAGGAVLYVVALATMSTAGGSGTLILSGGFLTGMAVGAASFAVVLSSVGRMVSVERRPMALGVVSAVGSLGQFVLVPIAQRIIDDGGWETAAVTMAVIAGLILVLSPAIRGNASEAIDAHLRAGDARPLRVELRRAARAKPYLLLNAAFFVCGFHVTFIATHLPSYAEDLGQSSTVGSTALALIGLFNVFGSLAAGALGGRHSKTRLLAGIYGLRGLVIAAFMIVPTSSAVTIGFGMAMGTLWLATVPLTSAMVTEQFGTEHSGTLFGIVFLAHQFGAFAGAWMGGEFADATGSYDPVWWIAVALAVLAMIVHLLIEEGPVPDEPALAGGAPRLAPAAGLTAVVLTLGITGALATAADPADAEAHSDVSVPYCVLAPPG